MHGGWSFQLRGVEPGIVALSDLRGTYVVPGSGKAT